LFVVSITSAGAPVLPSSPIVTGRTLREPPNAKAAGLVAEARRPCHRRSRRADYFNCPRISPFGFAALCTLK
jgi:hypothetical protein